MNAEERRQFFREAFRSGIRNYRYYYCQRDSAEEVADYLRGVRRRYRRFGWRRCPDPLERAEVFTAGFLRGILAGRHALGRGDDNRRFGRAVWRLLHQWEEADQ